MNGLPLSMHAGTPLHGHWFPAALSSRVRGRPLQVLLAGEPVVLFRDAEGVVQAWEDRCPHRAAPLSAGRIEDGQLVCAYHGWRFDREGRCRRMPGASPDLPPGNVRVPVWQVAEREGIVWICATPDRPLPDRLLQMVPGTRRFLWETTWQAAVIEAQENFLDALHTHTVHPGLVRRSARRPVRATARAVGDGFTIDYTGAARQSGLLYRLFESPRVREQAHFSGLSIAQIDYGYAAGWSAQITLCCRPESADRTRVFAMLHVQGRRAPAWLVRLLLWPFLRRVARQDQRMLALQRQTLAAFPAHRHIVTPMDIARPLLERAWRGESLADLPERAIELWL